MIFLNVRKVTVVRNCEQSLVKCKKCQPFTSEVDKMANIGNYKRKYDINVLSSYLSFTYATQNTVTFFIRDCRPFSKNQGQFVYRSWIKISTWSLEKMNKKNIKKK